MKSEALEGSNNQLIDIIIIADERGEELLPLTQNTCQAMLPIAGRPLLDHMLESLIPLNVASVKILVSSHSARIRKYVGAGDRWGLKVVYATSRGNTNIEKALLEHKAEGSKACLVLDTSEFRSLDMLSVINQLESQNRLFCRAKHAQKDIGICFQNTAHFGDGEDREIYGARVELELCQNILTLKNYHAANIRVAREKPKNIIIRGLEKEPGITSGAGTHITVDNLSNGEIIAGRQCRLEENVVCSGTVVLGNNVVVDRHTTLINSVVLDKTYIGEHLHVENAIVYRNSLIRVDRNTFITLEDDRLLGSLSRAAFIKKVESFTGRFLATVLLMCTLPLWIIALFDAALFHGRNLVTETRFIGNAKNSALSHREIKSFEINTRFPSFSKLPVLYQMALGHIGWFGVSVVSPFFLIGRTESWQFTRDASLVGLFGPAQLELGVDATSDEVLMADATFPGSTRFALLLRAVKKLLGISYLEVPVSKVSSR